MIDTTQLTQLISAFRVETEKESISPETVGSLLQNITDIIANASTDAELQIFENWKAILSQLNLVEDIGMGVEGVEYKLLNVRLFDKATMRKVYEQQTTNAKKKGVSNCTYCTIGHDNNRERIWKLN